MRVDQFRYLFIVYLLRGKGLARVITAMEMDEARYLLSKDIEKEIRNIA